MKRINQYNFRFVWLMPLFIFASCSKNFTDPSGPTSSQAFSSPNALTDVAVGLQNYYTAGRGGIVYNTITMDALLTNQLYVVNSGNTDEAQLGTGSGAVQNTNGIVTGLWTVCNKIIYDADSVIAQTNKIVTDKNYASGLIAYTSIFKAMAIGDMATFWDHVPVGVADTLGVSNVGFVTSAQGYINAIAVINNALSVVSANAISSTFLSNIPSINSIPVDRVDIVNTLYALKARYSLFAGNYADAISAANSVNRSVRSVFVYNSVVTNPIYTLATSTNNIYQPIDSTMGLPAGLTPSLSDKREPFYISISSTLPRYRINGFFNSTTTAIPVYLPGEMMLIKAESYARQNDLVNGTAWLDSVVVKQPSQDIFGIGAGLALPTVVSQTDLLNQIYQNRCIELFMSGLKLADERRFGRPVTERKRNYLPYPFVERNGNTNTPADPTF